MNYNDEWSGLAGFLANMIEKYVGQMKLEELPDPDKYYKLKEMQSMYRRYMRLSAKARKTA